MYNNAGLCGDLVSIGYVGTDYNGINVYYNGIGGTNLGNPCPTIAPTPEAEQRPPPCCAVGSEQAWRDRHAARIERITRRSEL